MSANEPQKPAPRATFSHRDYIDTKHAARILRVHVSTIYRLCLRGKIPARKRSGKFLILRHDLEQFAIGEPIAPPVQIDWPPRDPAA